MLALLVALVPASAAGAELVTMTVAVQTDTGDAVGGATVTATWENGSATGQTAQNGKVFLDVPTDQAVELTVDHETYMRNQPLVVEEPTEEPVTMTVRPKGEVDVQVNTPEGPADDALVTLSQNNQVVYSEETEDGTVENGPVEAGTYTLRVEKPGYYAETSTIEVTAAEPVTETVALEPGSITLRVNVTDPYFEPPRPLEGIAVTVDGQGSVNTQSDGRQQLAVPVNSPLTVTFEAEGYETVERSIETGEEAMTLDVDLHRADDLSVTVHTTEVVVGQPAFISVTDEYDDPVANATVTYDGETVTETDADGWAQIPVETAGTHTIQVSDADSTSADHEVVGVTAETTAAATETTVETAVTEETTGLTPGFGPLVALLGVLLAAGLALRTRR